MKKNDPYEILGVDRGATPQQIKSAHRKRVRETHPDVGGEREEFESVMRANIVLSDPKKREKYDRTGTMDEEQPDNELATPLSLIMGFMQAAVAQFVNGQGGDPETVDIFKLCIQNFRKQIHEGEDGKRKTERLIAKLNKMAARIEKKKGENYISRAFLGQADSMRMNLVQIDVHIQAHQDAIKMLEEYTFNLNAELHADPYAQKAEAFLRGFGGSGFR